jgi:Mg2+-importing ATPase
VDTAVDVAKDAADFVLLRKDLGILRLGIDEGRMTFANTLKYILTTISANFGNMFSMAVASLFLPFLPLLASQILLNNFLSDIPATAIASDRVDPEWVAKPRRWDALFIRNYMVVFGLLSSVFDLLTFAALLWLFQAAPEEFRTGWFIESLLTELVIALVVRTRRPFYRSRPGKLLLATTAAVMAVALVLPYLPFSAVFGFVPLPAPLMLGMIGLTLAYVLAVEIAKKQFYARVSHVNQRPF